MEGRRNGDARGEPNDNGEGRNGALGVTWREWEVSVDQGSDKTRERYHDDRQT